MNNCIGMWSGASACMQAFTRPLNYLVVRLAIFALEVTTQFILILCSTYLYYSYGHLTTKTSQWLRGLLYTDVSVIDQCHTLVITSSAKSDT